MPGTLQLDTIAAASLEHQGLSGRVVRTGTVIGIDATDPSDPDVMFKARDAALTGGASGYPGHPEFILSGVRVIGFTSNGCAVRLVYETFQGGAVSSYHITDRAYVAASQTNMIPGTRLPIRIGYDKLIAVVADPPNPDTEVRDTIPPDNVTLTFQRPWRAVSVSGLSYGRPADTYQDAVGLVNNAVWVGKAAGYWMLWEYETDESRYSGYYTYRATALTRNFEDWSETGILRSNLTGKYVQVDDADITTAMALAYAYGYIYPPGGTDNGKGFVRIGGSPTVDMGSIFGFTIIP